ncbi:unnamed protein product [Symbiodinium natans]|uniref:Uncharacterized protein n=1 Tax=Symbiodinium natans TaxID=878477 RepID=A0A812QP17_9DINO|nr:unnamed protein product [Symbiodinium natans]
MSLGILIVGLVLGFTQHEPLAFEPLAAVGGVIFTLGNLLCPLVIQLIGLGLGLTIWDLSNMLMGWVTGRFGLFGVDKEISARPIFNYSGLALACVSLVFMYLAARFDRKPKEASADVEDVEDVEDVVAPDESKVAAQEKQAGPAAAGLESESPMRLVMGSAMAVLAGILFGTMFDLPQDLMQGKFGQSLCSGLRVQPLPGDLCRSSCGVAHLHHGSAEEELRPLEACTPGHVLGHDLGRWHGCLV